MRRRLWWNIVLLDMRVAEISGAGKLIVMYSWNTKLPSNINDSDLFPDMREPPVERPGITEILFFRLRCEGMQLVQDSRTFTGAYTIKEDAILELEQRLERDYLSFCDPLIPLHLMSLMMGRTTLSKLKMTFRRPLFMASKATYLSAEDKDTLFQHS